MMFGATFFLTTRSIKNRVLRGLARLRQPRYAAGAVIAVAYFWMVLFRRHATLRIASSEFARTADILGLIISVLAFLIIVGVWALPGDSPGLVFSEAEIQFLFAAPLTRRQLLTYKTLRAQARGLFSAVIFSLFVFRGGNVFGIWLVFAAFDVYTRFASFGRARLRLAGIGWVWRLVASGGVFVACWAIASRQVMQSSALIADALRREHGANFIHTVASIASRPPLGTILAVPRVAANAIYAAPLPMIGSWLIVVAAAAALFLATTRLDVSFEDASIVASQRALARRTRMRASRFGTASSAVNRFPPPFRLGEHGRAEVAVVWKNLIGALRMSSFPIFALLAPLVLAAIASIFHERGEVSVALATFGFASAGFLAFAGPQALRADLRVDILRLDLIKTFPLSAESLLAAELAAPLLLISCAELALLGVSVGILDFASDPIPFFTSPEFVVSVFVFVVPICAIQLLIHNAAVILVPAWAMSGTDSGGFTVIGQRFLLLLGNVFVLGVALVPAAIVFLPALYIVRSYFGATPAGVLIATLPAAAVLVIEIAIAHRLLAGQFEDLDPANDLEMTA